MILDARRDRDPNWHWCTCPTNTCAMASQRSTQMFPTTNWFPGAPEPTRFHDCVAAWPWMMHCSTMRRLAHDKRLRSQLLAAPTNARRILLFGPLVPSLPAQPRSQRKKLSSELGAWEHHSSQSHPSIASTNTASARVR